MAPYPRSHRRWCDLPPEILDLVLQRLSLSDRFSFSGVCSSWRSVLLATNLCCHARPPPLMVLVCKHNSGQLMGLNGSQPPLKLRSPRPTLSSHDHIVGSSSGWLVIASRQESGLRLLNPASNKQILLPFTTSDGTSIAPYHKLNNESRLAVSLAVLSSSPTSPDCVLVARCHSITGDLPQGNSLASCRPGRDREWTTFAVPRSILLCSHMAFHNGELVLFDSHPDHGHPHHGRILIYNFDPHPILRSYSIDPIPNFMSPILLVRWKLVSSGGELFLAALYEIPKVYKLGPGGWEEVESLGDRVLLISFLSAELFCTRDLMGSGFEPNCIYYQIIRGKPVDRLTKFSMADGSTETIPLPLDDHQSRNLLGFEWVVMKHA